MSSKSIDKHRRVWYNVPQMGTNQTQGGTMRQIRARMTDEMIEQIEQKAADLNATTNCNVTFSDALRHLVTIGLKNGNSSHDGEISNATTANPPISH